MIAIPRAMEAARSASPCLLTLVRSFSERAVPSDLVSRLSFGFAFDFIASIYRTNRPDSIGIKIARRYTRVKSVDHKFETIVSLGHFQQPAKRLPPPVPL
jgi:hypothetical protein